MLSDIRMARPQPWIWGFQICLQTLGHSLVQPIEAQNFIPGSAIRPKKVNPLSYPVDDIGININSTLEDEIFKPQFKGWDLSLWKSTFFASLSTRPQALFLRRAKVPRKCRVIFRHLINVSREGGAALIRMKPELGYRTGWLLRNQTGNCLNIKVC